MRGSIVDRVVVESCESGPLPLTPAAIRIVPAKTAAASSKISSDGRPPASVNRHISASSVTCCTTNRR